MFYAHGSSPSVLFCGRVSRIISPRSLNSSVRSLLVLISHWRGCGDAPLQHEILSASRDGLLERYRCSWLRHPAFSGFLKVINGPAA